MNHMSPSRDFTPAERADAHQAESELEFVLLGTLLMHKHAFHNVPQELEPGHFSEPFHQKIFQEMARLHATERPIDLMMVKAALPSEQVAGMTVAKYLSLMCGAAGMPISVHEQAMTIIRASAKRRGDMIGQNVQQASKLGELEYMEEIEALWKQLGDVVNDLQMKEDMNGDAAADAYLSSITGARSDASSGGVPICLPELENVLSDHLFREKRLYGLLSSSGEGKTSLTMQIIYAALMAGHPVLMLSYDQTRTECIAQMAAQALGVEVRRQLENTRENPLLKQNEVDECYQFARKVFNLPFEVIDCDAEDTAERLCSYAKRFLKKKANGLTPLIVIDHIRAIKPEDSRVDEGTKALVIGQKLKSLAKSTGSAVVVLQQRSGAGMRRENPRPIAADLYGGEAARQPFDAIFYLYRAELHMGRQVDTARDDNDADKIRARFRQTFGGEIEGNAELGCLKLRFGNPNTKRHVRFDERLTKYVSKRTPASQERML